LAHAPRLSGTKRVMPERVILQKRLAACNAAGRLIHCFDRISADGLDRLVTVRAKVGPGLRFEEGLCLLKAVPFRDCHALGWGWSVQTDNLSAACAAAPAIIDNTTVYRIFITPSTCRRTPASGGARTMLRWRETGSLRMGGYSTRPCRPRTRRQPAPTSPHFLSFLGGAPASN
jgi:hypothetical protein